MILAVDDAIPYWDEAFRRLGEVRPFPGRSPDPAKIRDADALIVRSVTRVDEGLLQGTRVRFVGSATIGMDHVDEEYLKRRGIRFTNAAGSNANAVAEWVVAALLVASSRRGRHLRGRSIAVVGVGNVGSRVVGKARALGMEVRLCDPPLRESTGDDRYRDLQDVLPADFVTLHVPLTVAGPYPTRYMLSRQIFEKAERPDFLINSARGAVVANDDLGAALRAGQIEGAVLDVWEHEPRIDRSLLDLVDLGTPHVAGYSLDGKIRATEMIFEALCRHFEIDATWDTSHLFPPPLEIEVPDQLSEEEAVRRAVLKACDITRDDLQLRAVSSMSVEEAGAEFDRLRNEYPLRGEFRHFIVELPQKRASLEGTLQSLGFQTRLRQQTTGPQPSRGPRAG